VAISRAAVASLFALTLAACETDMVSERARIPARPSAAAPVQGGRVLGRTGDAVVVQVGPGEDAGDLARRYLGDERKAWRVASLEADGLLRPGGAAVAAVGATDPTGRPVSARRVPILCYHRLTTGRGTRMETPAAAFERQLRYLRDNGYTVISLDDLAAFLEGRADVPARAVVITIDDGYRSTYDIAYPLLKRYGAPATVFVYTDFVGARDAMTPAQLRELRQSGLVEIQSHTKTHGDLRPRGPAGAGATWRRQIQLELAGSRDRLGELAGEKPTALAYPYGAADAQVTALAAGAGYSLGLTLIRGGNESWTSPLLLHRDMIFGDEDLGAFARRLGGGARPPATAAGRGAGEDRSRLRRRIYQESVAAASGLERAGRLREALWKWSVAEAVADDPAEARSAMDALEGRIGGQVARLTAEGDRQRRKGALSAAQAAYKAALDLDPESRAARGPLRDLDAQAALRTIARSGAGGPPAPVVAR
jgi:peptidoglycan/xylan/chitin deacetylase (PgdA/CDA1 family)